MSCFQHTEDDNTMSSSFLYDKCGGAKSFQTKQGNFPSGVCYLDHVGATLYAQSQIKAIAEDLCENVYGNPHSLSTSSRYSTDVIDQIRYRCVILTLNYVRRLLITRFLGVRTIHAFSSIKCQDVSVLRVSDISLVHKKYLCRTSQ